MVLNVDIVRLAARGCDCRRSMVSGGPSSGDWRLRRRGPPPPLQPIRVEIGGGGEGGFLRTRRPLVADVGGGGCVKIREISVGPRTPIYTPSVGRWAYLRSAQYHVHYILYIYTTCKREIIIKIIPIHMRRVFILYCQDATRRA